MRRFWHEVSPLLLILVLLAGPTLLIWATANGAGR